MDLWKAIVLGIIQGLAEFLPISSSGHLVLAEKILNFTVGGLAFEVFLHFGTLLAVVWVFRKDLWKMVLALPVLFAVLKKNSGLPDEQKNYALLIWYLFLGSIPAAAVGLFFESQIEQLFESALLVLFMLFLTGLIMWSARYTRESNTELTAGRSLLIGTAQALAIIPGISRSGSTIVSGLWMGIPRDLVARYSFLLSVPVIFGATVIKFKDLIHNPLPHDQLLGIALGTVASAVSGYFAIIWLLDLIRRQKLEWFGVYCIAVSLIGLVFIYLF